MKEVFLLFLVSGSVLERSEYLHHFVFLFQKTSKQHDENQKRRLDLVKTGGVALS